MDCGKTCQSQFQTTTDENNCSKRHRSEFKDQTKSEVLQHPIHVPDVSAIFHDPFGFPTPS